MESLLESALACPKHPSPPVAASDYSSGCTESPEASTSVWAGVPSLTRLDPQLEECEATASYSDETSADGRRTVVSIPARDAIAQEPAVRFSETREALDVTAKFFYLPPVDNANGDGLSSTPTFDPSWIEDGLRQLHVATGLETVDTFIISFPGLVFDEKAGSRDCCDDANSRQTTALAVDESAMNDNIAKVWKSASGNKRLKSMGVSEFSLDRLQWLLQTAGDDATTGVTSTFRKPRVAQVNTRAHCDVPSDLVDFAQDRHIDLLVHSDCSGMSTSCPLSSYRLTWSPADFLPPRTFTRLLARHGARLPAPLLQASSNSIQVNGDGPSDGEATARAALQTLSARWVLKVSLYAAF